MVVVSALGGEWANVEVWRAMVGSGMKYGGEVWWGGVVEDRDLESIQLGVFKGILRLNKSTTDEFVRGEVGALELKRESIKQC